MAIVAVPAALKVRRATWRLVRPAQVNRSGYTGRRKVVAAPWHGRWEGSIETAPLALADAQAVRGFLAAMRGQVNTCRLRATESGTSTGTAIKVYLAQSAGITTLNSYGWQPNSTVAKAGAMFTVNDQLCILTADAVSGGTGIAALSFEPPLRTAPAGDTVIEAGAPTALVALAESAFEWSADLGPVYQFSFNVEEHF